MPITPICLLQLACVSISHPFSVAEQGNPAHIAEPTSNEAEKPQSQIRYFECGDRDTEIRTIAKEIKRLIISDQYQLTDIALVVRQRAEYVDTISRVMADEDIPCNLSARVQASDVPANRAVLKLLALLEECSQEDATTRISDLGDLIKSEYFRLKNDIVNNLWSQFLELHLQLLGESSKDLRDKSLEQLKHRYRIGLWDADALENTFAYVGSELRVNDWIARSQKLIQELPAATSTKELLNIDSGALERDPDIADQVENAETAKHEEKDVVRKRRPSRDIHPATIAWTAMIVQAVAERLQALPREGKPIELRSALMRLLEDLSFRQQVTKPIRSANDNHELPRLILNFNSLEAVRRSFVAAIRSIQAVWGQGLGIDRVTETVRLAIFVQEVRRSLVSQSEVFSVADRGGLRVLEATDVRGLRFRALFIAGLIEGGFPLRVTRDRIYPHEERERLKQYGLT